MGVELRHFAALDAVASEGSFSRAAVRLGYTQSAVSQQIAALERAVGERLVERPGGPRAVSLTEAGELLRRHAAVIVNRLDAARADMAALRAGETGMLRVATYQSVSARVLPRVMGRFLAEWPGIELGLSEPSNDPELYDAVEAGEVDLAFCSLPTPEGPFEARALLTDPYVLLVPSTSPLAERASVSFADLGDTA
ncbi:MAG: LysR family transcriptional regulator, partial [Gaiella sp.]